MIRFRKQEYPKEWTNTTLEDWDKIEDIDDLHETLSAMRNRIDVLLELNQHDDLAYAIPTVLEDLFEDAQRLIEDYSIDD